MRCLTPTMGKSLRSKPTLRAKSVKRKGEFHDFVEARDARLAEKMKADLERQKNEAAQKKPDQTAVAAEEKKAAAAAAKKVAAAKKAKKRKRKSSHVF